MGGTEKKFVFLERNKSDHRKEEQLEKPFFMWQQFVENTNAMNYNNSICVWSGRYGDFWGCTGYPDGRYTEKQRRKIKDERLR